MNARTRTRIRIAVASALLASLALGPLAGAAAAHPVAAATGAGSAPVADGPDTAALEKALAGLPDGDVSAALVRVGGKGTWTGTAGVRDLRTGAPALENARFRAGSTTKTVTAAIVLQLVAEGRVELDAPVTRYLPGLLPASFAESPTVRHLLTYTSGLQPGASLGATTEEMYVNRFRTLTPERVVATAVAKGPASDPGERQVYQNIDYTVLGLLIEKVTGDRYEHQADVRIFRPLGMRHTGFPAGADPRVRGPHHRAYADIGGRTTDVTEWNMSDRWAAGNMISTTADLERFLMALFRGRVVPRPLLDQMLTVPDVDGATYGMAWERYVHNGREIWGKTGSRPGYHTVLAATRDLSRTVVYSVNARSAREDGFPLVARFALPAFNR
ncbi:serine hydrolase domain-containing protein [Streptomyces viridosporus]|uniref:Class A beta-lactamase-related serine hydrolase n=1 Tax=Streptomyces viridosporus T7A TaxID=665577 RepID=A0ABX6AD82_STRVD|nr:serine hydrolase domain-containing protein [Streptomyces viridosporus]QEU85440.1 class A beta-lactamase-related serine hydrolase [Streptomyces viridosporus T7A]